MRKKKYLELQKRIDREKKLHQVELAMEDKLLLKVKLILFLIKCRKTFSFCFRIQNKMMMMISGRIMKMKKLMKRKNRKLSREKNKKRFLFSLKNKEKKKHLIVYVCFCFR